MNPDPMSPEAARQEINVIPLNFRVDFIPDKNKPGALREIHRVDLVKKGSHGESTPWSIPAIQKDPMLWNYIEPYYKHWLKGQADPVEGTPLDVLSFLPPSIVSHLKNIHIRTAEDLANATDGDLERIGMGARGWRQKARSYLEAQAGGQAAAVNAALKTENEQMRAELAELKATVNALVGKSNTPRLTAADMETWVQPITAVSTPVAGSVMWNPPAAAPEPMKKRGWPKGKPRGTKADKQ